jgi:hypothetical protein
MSCDVAHRWESWNVLLIARPSCSALQHSAHQVHSPLVDQVALVDARNLHTESILCPMGFTNNGPRVHLHHPQGCPGGAQRNVTLDGAQDALARDALKLYCHVRGGLPI